MFGSEKKPVGSLAVMAPKPRPWATPQVAVVPHRQKIFGPSLATPRSARGSDHRRLGTTGALIASSARPGSAAAGALSVEKTAWLSKVRIDGLYLRQAPEHLQADRTVVLNAVQECGQALQFAKGNLQSDRDTVRAAVRQDGLALEHASQTLKADVDIVWDAVRQNVEALAHAHKEAVIGAVQRDGLLLRIAHALKGDVSVVIAAVSQNGRSLRYVQEDLQADRSVVLQAVKQNGAALLYAHASLRADKAFMITAVQHCPASIHYAHEDLKADRCFMTTFVQQDGHLLRHAHEALRADKDLVIAAIRQNPGALEHAAESLKNHREVVTAAVEQDGMLLCHAHEDLRGDWDVAVAAVTNNGMALKFASDYMRGSEEVAMAAAKQNGASIRFVKKPLAQDDPVLLEVAGPHSSGEEPEDDLPSMILSVRYGRTAMPSPVSRNVHLHLQQHADFSDVRIYNPNASCSGFCGCDGKDSTNADFPCLGDCGVVCKHGDACDRSPQCKTLPSTALTLHSCWRRAFRHNQRKAKMAGGYMVQIALQKDSLNQFELGMGQLIEAQLAAAEGLKTFRIQVLEGHAEAAVARLAVAVRTWRDTGSPCEELLTTIHSYEY